MGSVGSERDVLARALLRLYQEEGRMASLVQGLCAAETRACGTCVVPLSCWTCQGHLAGVGFMFCMLDMSGLMP